MEILLAVVVGYLLCHLRSLMHRRAMAQGEHLIAKDVAESRRGMTKAWEELVGKGPLHLRVEGDQVVGDHTSGECRGPHSFVMDGACLEARREFAQYLAERIAAGRFASIILYW